jgi:hypothetical protein
MTNEQIEAAFEQFVRRLDGDACQKTFNKYEVRRLDEKYMCPVTQNLWLGYKAAIEASHAQYKPLLQEAYDVMEQAVDDMRDGYSVCPAVKLWMLKWMDESGIESESGHAPDLNVLLKYDPAQYKPLVEALRSIKMYTIPDCRNTVPPKIANDLMVIEMICDKALATLPEELRG